MQKMTGATLTTDLRHCEHYARKSGTYPYFGHRNLAEAEPEPVACPQLDVLEEAGIDALQPSRTAQGAAIHRAAHQLLDAPAVFRDPLALVLIGGETEAQLRAH